MYVCYSIKFVQNVHPSQCTMYCVPFLIACAMYCMHKDIIYFLRECPVLKNLIILSNGQYYICAVYCIYERCILT